MQKENIFQHRFLPEHDCYANNLISVKISKPSLNHPKIIPSCMVINARSLVKPDAAVALYTKLHTNNIDLCFVSETCLNSKVASSLIFPDGYLIVRKDRCDLRAGRGVSIFCRNDWISISYDFECLWCEIITVNSEYHVAVVYHPPNPAYADVELLDHLSDTCEQILSSKPNVRIIIAGDIYHLNVRDLRSQHNLAQMVRKVTRGHRVLDVFLTNCPHIWKPPVVFNGLVRSDHLAIMVTPRVAARPDRSCILEMLGNTGRFKWSISWKRALGVMYCLVMISPKRFTYWKTPSKRYSTNASP